MQECKLSRLDAFGLGEYRAQSSLRLWWKESCENLLPRIVCCFQLDFVFEEWVGVYAQEVLACPYLAMADCDGESCYSGIKVYVVRWCETIVEQMLELVNISKHGIGEDIRVSGNSLLEIEIYHWSSKRDCVHNHSHGSSKKPLWEEVCDR